MGSRTLACVTQGCALSSQRDPDSRGGARRGGSTTPLLHPLAKPVLHPPVPSRSFLSTPPTHPVRGAFCPFHILSPQNLDVTHFLVDLCLSFINFIAFGNSFFFSGIFISQGLLLSGSPLFEIPTFPYDMFLPCINSA